MKTYYKIVDMINGNMKFLYHGLNGSLTIPLRGWIMAEKREVTDGSCSTRYVSGFHVFKTKEEADKYLGRFRKLKTKLVVAVHCRGIRKKEHSNAPVFLADKIKLIWNVRFNDNN